MPEMNLLNALEWKGNSRKMYEAVLNAVPFFLRGGVKSNITEWVIKNNISVVTEELVFKAVDDIAPSNIANSMIKPELEKLRTETKRSNTL